MGYPDAAAFAQDIGLTKEEYLAIESGAKQPDFLTLIRAGHMTGRTLDFLITGLDTRRCIRDCGTFILPLLAGLKIWVARALLAYTGDFPFI